MMMKEQMLVCLLNAAWCHLKEANARWNGPESGLSAYAQRQRQVTFVCSLFAISL